jgi:hypothetical protein
MAFFFLLQIAGCLKNELNAGSELTGCLQFKVQEMTDLVGSWQS